MAGYSPRFSNEFWKCFLQNTSVTDGCPVPLRKDDLVDLLDEEFAHTNMKQFLLPKEKVSVSTISKAIKRRLLECDGLVVKPVDGNQIAAILHSQ